VNFATFGVMAPSMFGFGMFVAAEREQGLLTLKRGLPMPATAYPLAKMLMTMLFATIVMVALIAAALAVGPHSGHGRAISLAGSRFAGFNL
jgi:ABC-2 type transport system permease protein